MNFDFEKEKIKRAISKFIKNDRDVLYKNRVNEMAISHRIAVYLEEEFSRYNIDCEYSKNIKNLKSDDLDKTIRPDIIIHKRDSNIDNFIIIEVKRGSKNTNLARKDIKKLKRIKNLSYKFMLFIGVLNKSVDLVWLEKDSDIENYETL